MYSNNGKFEISIL